MKNPPNYKKKYNFEYKKYLYIEKYIQKNNLISLHGYGFLGKWVLNDFKRNGVLIKYLFDNNDKKFKNKTVLNPSKIKTINTPIIVCSRHFTTDIKNEYEKKKVIAISADCYYFFKNYEKFMSLFEDFQHDPKSLFTLDNIIRILIEGELNNIDHLEKNMYFSIPEFFPDFNSTFVDAGAFTGDIIEDFIKENMGSFNKIYAFEPGLIQLQAMKYRIKRLCVEWAIDKKKILIKNCALGDSNKYINFNYQTDDILAFSYDINNHTKKNQKKIRVVSLDSFFENQSIDILKADVEGMEISLLKGGKELIKRLKPRLAIAAYHYPNDIYEICNLIKSYRKDYKFKLRHHANVIGDYVLYGY